MKVSRSLKEVWTWKQAVYEATKDMDKNELLQYFNKGANRFLEKMGYKKMEVCPGVYTISKAKKTSREIKVLSVREKEKTIRC